MIARAAAGSIVAAAARSGSSEWLHRVNAAFHDNRDPVCRMLRV